MSEEADAVSRAVQEYEQRIAEDPDALAVRALLQGTLMGYAMKDRILNIKDVQVEKDDEGLYNRYFVVHMGSGIRLRVSVEVEK